MTDQDYLAKVIATYTQLDELMPHFRVLISDVRGITLFCSKLYIITRGSDNLTVGSSSLPAGGGKYHPDQALAEWQEVVQTKLSKHAINVNLFEGVVQPYLTSKYPLINEETGNVVAIFNVRQKVLYNSIQHQLLRALDIYPEAKIIDFEKYKLTKREKQLIFLFLSGLSSKEIALILSKVDNKDISKKTIDSILIIN